MGSFAAGSQEDVDSSVVRLINHSSGKCIASFDCDHHVENNAVILCTIFRDPSTSRWTMRTIGQAATVTSYAGLDPAIQQQLSDSLPKVLELRNGMDGFGSNFGGSPADVQGTWLILKGRGRSCLDSSGRMPTWTSMLYAC